MNKDELKQLYILQVLGRGIDSRDYGRMPASVRKALERREGRYFLKQGERRKFTVALTGGAFDILHIGHIFTLERAKELADVLVVVVARDETVRMRKKREPIHAENYRRRMVEALKPVDLAIVGGSSPLETVARVSPDIVVYGYDQKPFVKEGGFKSVKLRSHMQKHKYKTSKIIRELEL